MKAFILAAGLGTRLKPITDTIPKALVEIKGKTLLELTISELVKFGFNEIIINVHHFADQIIDYLKSKNNFDVMIKISDERDLLLDTGGGLKYASWFLNDGSPFLIHNVDIISDMDLSELYKQHINSNSVATLAVQRRKSSRYFLFDEEKKLCGWKNEKTGEVKTARESKGSVIQLAFSGVHVVSPSIFSVMPDKNVFSIVDLYLSIARQKLITYFDHTGSVLIDLGKKENLIEAGKTILK
jgi:NDP-sugar pyrophosphorylase family protein